MVAVIFLTRAFHAPKLGDKFLAAKYIHMMETRSFEIKSRLSVCLTKVSSIYLFVSAYQVIPKKAYRLMQYCLACKVTAVLCKLKAVGGFS
jgi:hypothetical protein